MSKNTINTTIKTPLKNDFTNHLAILSFVAFQLEQRSTEKKAQQKNSHSSYETLLTDIVTCEFIRGYN